MPTEYTNTLGIESNFTQPVFVAKGSNPNYFVDIRCFSKGLHIVADMPEQTIVSLSAEWENRLPSSTAADAVPGAGRAAAAGASTNAVAQFATQQIWMNSTPVEFSISLLFDAEVDAKTEVNDPMARLETLVLPQVADRRGFFGTLVSPGPSRGSSGGSPVDIKIGQTLSLPNAIVTSVSNTYDNRLDANGYPIAGESEITIRAPHLYSDKEWLALRGVSST